MRYLANNATFYVYIHARVKPSNAFRLVLKVAKYTAVFGDDGLVEMSDQEHELWLDRSVGYSLALFHEDMATKIIWGPSQTLSIWVLDSDTIGSEWKIRRDEHWQKMIEEKWKERVAYIAVEVTAKDGYETNDSGIPPRSGVTNVDAYVGPNSEGIADTCTSPVQDANEAIPVDWATLTIIQDEAKDGEANAIADEDVVYEAMGFQEAHERAEEAATEEIPIPTISKELEREMEDAAIPVDDTAPTEPMADWDRDFPDMSVGTHYPCMDDFRMALRQHAIVKDFEFGTKKSDKGRFTGYCKAAGCPWVIRAKTQRDKSVRVYF
jgi:hypothetical protein